MLAALRSWSDCRSARSAAKFAHQWSEALAVPDYFLQLLILIEDKRFPKHWGVDPIAILRAAIANTMKRGVRQGGSTLAQQLYNVQFARKSGKRRSRSYPAKLVQIALGFWINLRLSKEAILSEYLDSVYWGRNLWGIDEAAHGYWGKRRQELSVEESFFLIERLCSPNRPSSERVSVILKRAPIISVLTANQSSANLLRLFYERHRSATVIA